jgi:hypothetical protein
MPVFAGFISAFTPLLPALGHVPAGAQVQAPSTRHGNSEQLRGGSGRHHPQLLGRQGHH